MMAKAKAAAPKNGTWRSRIVGSGDEKPGDLIANPRNWRLHPKAQQDALAGVLTEVGWVQNIIVNKRTGYVVDGHARVALAVSRDEPTVPVVYVDLDENEEGIVLAALDPLAAMAGTDKEKLDALLADITVSDEALRAMLKEPDSGLTDDDAIPEAPEPTTKLGDLWLLGEHRLLCGDATKAEDVERLMEGARAAMSYTDPPYGVAYASERFDDIENDALTRDDLTAFLTASFRNLLVSMAPEAPAYIWHASATREDYAYAMQAAGLVELQYLIWVKGSLVLGRSDYQWQHEPCFYAGRDGDSAPPFYGDRTQTTVWSIAALVGGERAMTLGSGVLVGDGAGHEIYIAPKAPKRKLRTIRLAEDAVLHLLRESGGETDVWEVKRDTVRADHPTQKPVELGTRAIENSSRPGEAVLDPFLGSGTTLIACEKLGRRCYGMEIEPRYVDVAVRRWEEYTGQEAVLDG